MSGFSAEWLALREPMDLPARNAHVEDAFLGKLPRAGARILDLASGAGSTLAALGERVPDGSQWMLTDYDPDLVSHAKNRWAGSLGQQVEIRQIDLSRDLEQLPFQQNDAVTTSAFLDLVSESFLHRLTDCIVAAQVPFLASLSYDGRAVFQPAHDLDEHLRAALNADQLGDKGFGPSLGPGSAATAMRLFSEKGYRVVEGTSDWDAGPTSSAFLREFLSGWHDLGQRAGLETGALQSWWQKRGQQINAGQLSVKIGHIDFAALPE